MVMQRCSASIRQAVPRGASAAACAADRASGIVPRWPRGRAASPVRGRRGRAARPGPGHGVDGGSLRLVLRVGIAGRDVEGAALGRSAGAMTLLVDRHVPAVLVALAVAVA